MLKISFISFLLLFSFDVMANNITSNQVQNYVGKKATVCGKIAEISTVNNNTFINIDAPHPYQKFYFYTHNQTLSNKYLFRTVCGTGVVRMHKGKFQIILSDIRSLSLK